ncbi:hypothetical protein DASC09_033570 [Saccharomycopsis crataegensis]|uniref:Regulator of free ubiquitin chains 1 n=1 Tax=Saccharomycopsis crataegensis TaxID=43959 RepID=A0AAV5QN62_9ASCO|nr:hypothetical protein DASC09_033570 [Saccharomycopsis crataegensis]
MANPDYRPPKEPSQLEHLATSYPYDDRIPYTAWLKMAHNTYKKARAEEEANHNYPEAYLFYHRFLDMILVKIPSHPEFVDRSSYQILRDKYTKVHQRCQALKPLIESEIEEFNLARKLRKKKILEQRQLAKQRSQLHSSVQEEGEEEEEEEERPQQNFQEEGNSKETYDEEEEFDASQFGQESFQLRRNFSDLTTTTSDQRSQPIVRYPSLNFDQPPPQFAFAKTPVDTTPQIKEIKEGSIVNDDVQNNQLAHQHQVQQSYSQENVSNGSTIERATNAVNNLDEDFEFDNGDEDHDVDEESILVPDYPTIANEPSLIKMYKPFQQSPEEQSTPHPLPDGEDAINFTNSPITISSPQRPPKVKSAEEIKSANNSKISINDQESANDVDVVDHQVEAFTEGGIPLKTVFIPVEIQSKFTAISAAQTAKDIETCGILCGKLVHNAFYVTDLVIPDQNGTSNTCSTSNEEQLLSYVDANDLFILGWIHTHPTQACFLSSVDLHTQNGYQLMLPESIAIVVAPNSNPNFGIFRLSDPFGVNLITNCAKRGFHPHTEEGLYDMCSKNNGGHVSVKRNLPLKVTDIRTT